MLIKDINKEDLSNTMRKYVDLKEQHPEELLFYQIGDFYEMFFDDAYIASKVLDLTLTGKECGLGERAPMCGIPVHAIENYLPKLVQAGHKVMLVYQLNDSSHGPKDPVERDILKIVTAGTLTENIDERKNNYIASLIDYKGKLAVAYADITTGKLNVLGLNSIKEVQDTLTRISPSEIICNQSAKLIEKSIPEVDLSILPHFYLYDTVAYQADRAMKICKKHFGVQSLSVFDLDENSSAEIIAVGGLLEYLNETQKRNLVNINKIVVEKPANYMYIDSNTRRNLELTENMTTKKKIGSLVGLLDKTKTNMGARLLRTRIEQPIALPDVINKRLDAVEEFTRNKMLVDDIRQILASINDIERISGKIAYGNVMPKDCLFLKDSLVHTRELYKALRNVVVSKDNACAVDELVGFEDIINLISSAIVSNPPTTLKEGGYIAQGFNKELDTYLSAGTMGKQWLAELESRTKEETGIRNIKISYNRIFGYYIEIPKAQESLVPQNWIRRQTTANSERYISEELKKMEDKILSSGQLAIELEAKLYCEIKDFLKSKINLLQGISNAIARIDVNSALALVSLENNWTRPVINENVDEINIVDGRHPVIEALLNNSSFVPNNCLLDTNENRILLITGPNMAGKSTYMRQVAVITLMAHIGSFVPAHSAEISITDRIFTRIGASDDLAFGQSTFMVEMTEVANILNNATNKSLLVLDEIGRGTSTYDGLSIAWSVVEYLASHLNVKTLFATHYHELTDLEGKIEGVKNYRVLIKELNGEIAFLHKIARGSANKSFGIEVASLAGLPAEIIKRSKEILAIQESANTKATDQSYDNKSIVSSKTKKDVNVAEVLNVLGELDMNTVSPLVAFATLQNLVDKVKKND